MFVNGVDRILRTHIYTQFRMYQLFVIESENRDSNEGQDQDFIDLLQNNVIISIIIGYMDMTLIIR